jgi:hypothetical protein
MSLLSKAAEPSVAAQSLHFKQELLRQFKVSVRRRLCPLFS